MATQTPTQIPIFDMGPQVEALWPEFQAAFERVMKSGHYILGPEVQAFESEVAAYLGVKHAIGLNSGTDALFLALRALGEGGWLVELVASLDALLGLAQVILVPVI